MSRTTARRPSRRRASQAPAGQWWWGDFDIPLGQSGHWHIGPLDLWLTHLAGEWRIGHRLGEEPLANDVRLEIPLAGPVPDTDVIWQRFGFRSEPDRVTVRPALADRPVVVKPDMPLALPGGEALTLYMSSPVWIQLWHAEDAARPLLELPSWRLSDTWFGPSTRTGELCYGSRSRARLQLGEVEVLWARAITAVTIVNRRHDSRPLNAVKLPIPWLGLHVDNRGRFWTEVVEVEIPAEGGTEVRRTERPPAEAGDAFLIAEPRQAEDRGRLIRTFEALLA